MSLAVRDLPVLTKREIKAVRVGAWVAECLTSNTTQNWRLREIPYGRPRRVLRVLHAGETRRGRAYANVLLSFGDVGLPATLTEGSARYKLVQRPDLFDLARAAAHAELSTEIADL